MAGSKDLDRRQDPAIMPLDDIRSDIDRVVYSGDEEKDAMTLVWAVTHKINPYNALPRVLITSTLPEGGKTTWLNLSTYVANNAWKTDPTPFAMRSKLIEPERITAIFDEISKIFGESGLRGHGSPIYKLLVESYLRNATISFSVDRVAQDVSSFCVAIMAGLRTAAPDDLRRRSIKIVMKPVPETMELESSLDSGIEATFRGHHDRLHAWMNMFDTDELADLARNYRHYHPKLRSRKAEIWTPLFVVAEVAGGTWPERVRAAFIKLALDATERPVLSNEQQLLMDAADLVGTMEGPYLTSAALLKYLRSLKENKLYPMLSNRQMAILMSKALEGKRTLTLPGHRTAKGWSTAPILKAADELQAILDPEDEDPEEDEFDKFFDEDVEYEG